MWVQVTIIFIYKDGIFNHTLLCGLLKNKEVLYAFLKNHFPINFTIHIWNVRQKFLKISIMKKMYFFLSAHQQPYNKIDARIQY